MPVLARAVLAVLFLSVSLLHVSAQIDCDDLPSNVFKNKRKVVVSNTDELTVSRPLYAQGALFWSVLCLCTKLNRPPPAESAQFRTPR